MYCTACGTPCPEGANFCAQCGTPLTDPGDRPTGTIPRVLETQPQPEESTQADPGTELTGELNQYIDYGAVRAALEPNTALLVCVRGPNAGARFLLDHPTTTVGRHPDSSIFLDDITVSRRHSEFRQQDGELSVVDVGSLNGTYVNGHLVDRATLVNGDAVQIGKYRLVAVLPQGKS
ncbi:FHA domain-containing protein [Stomatohabitans albus]